MTVDMERGVLIKSTGAVKNVASDAVRLGGKSVRIAAQTSVKPVKLNKAIERKVRLAKQKTKKLKARSEKLSKAKAHALNSVKNVGKRGLNAAGAIIDKSVEALGKSDNEAAQFAKKSYDAAKMAGRAAVKTGKTVKNTVKTGRKLLTKKGRRGLAKSVKRQIKTAKRTVRNIKRAAKATAKAVKAVAKLVIKVAKAVAQLVTKLVTLIAETAPWSLIVIGVIALVIIAVNVITVILGNEEENNTAGLVGAESDVTDIYTNLTKFEEMFAAVAKEKITDPLKTAVTNFCGDDGSDDTDTEEDEDADESSTDTDDADDDSEESGSSQNFIEFNGEEFFPASGNADEINERIEQYVDSGTSSQRFASLLAALKVLEMKKTGELPEAVFTKSDFEAFIGTVNSNTCEYGDTFFIKTTVTVGGQTCPDENCRTDYCDDVDDCESPETDDEGNEYCPGHDYCDNDHKKMTITLKTVEEYYTDKGIPEIYGFDEDEEYQYEAFKEFIAALVEEKNDPGNLPNYYPELSGGTSVDYDYSYEPPDFSISSSNVALLVLLVIGFIAFGIRKRGG